MCVCVFVVVAFLYFLCGNTQNCEEERTRRVLSMYKIMVAWLYARAVDGCLFDFKQQQHVAGISRLCVITLFHLVGIAFIYLFLFNFTHAVCLPLGRYV